MAESRVIFLIVSAVIAGSLLLLSTNVLQGVKSQITKIIQIGEAEESKFNPGGLYSACQYWLSLQSARYDSKVILNQIKLPDLMYPYPNLKSCCAEHLRTVAEKCYQGGVIRGECVGNGYIDATAVEGCVVACENILQIYDLCHMKCPQKEYTCMNELIEGSYTDICRSSADELGLSYRLEKACR